MVSEIDVPSSRTSTGTRWNGLSRVNSGVFNPFMMSTSSKGTSIPFSARNMRTRRGLGAVFVWRIFIAVSPAGLF